VTSDDCGCCATTPAGAGDVDNRPGLSAVAYRAGTFASFRKSIVEALAHTPGLERLTARTQNDYTITAIELWSAVADVLTFYQERVANEGFLRTATSRDSVLRLVRLIGYELAPGLAATTWLAFTVERGGKARVPARTRVKSVPVAQEAPQTFETLAPLEADAAWNVLEPFRARVHQVAAGDTYADFVGVATGVVPGDVLVFVGDNKRANPKSPRWDVARVRKVEPDARAQRTRITWAPKLGSTGRPIPADARVYVMRQRAFVFGHNAPDWHLIPDAGKAQILGLPGPGDVSDDDRVEWPQFEIYAPLNPGQPRQRRSPGLQTVMPTAESVAAAALAAAKAEKEAIDAEAAAAAAEAAVALGKVTAAANDANAELTRLILSEGAKAVTGAISQLGSLQNAIAALEQEAQGLEKGLKDAIFWFDVSRIADPSGATGSFPFEGAISGNVPGATAIKDGLHNLPTDLSGSALKALDELLKAFKKIAQRAGLAPLDPGDPPLQLPDLADKLALVAALTAEASKAADWAALLAQQPVGALAVERAVEIALGWAKEHSDELATAIPLLTAPRRIGAFAILAAELADYVLRAEPVIHLGPSEAAWLVANTTGITSRGSEFLNGIGMTVALLNGGVARAATPLLASATLWPLLFGAVVGAMATAVLAEPGARRVADAVRKAVLIALEPKILTGAPRYAPRALSHTRVDLDTVYPSIVGGSWLLLSSSARAELYQIREVGQTSRTDFALTGAVTRVRLAGNGLAPDPQTGHSVYGVRDTAVFAVSHELSLALDATSTPFSGATLLVVGALGPATPGRALLVTGTDAATGLPASDVVTLTDATAASTAPTGVPHTVLQFEPPVQRFYALDGLVVYGNVAFATHGETVKREVLGDGDASVGFQRFPLQKKPVTFIPAAKPGIVQSSLELSVDGVAWTAVPTLYGASERDQVYTSRIADDKTLTVQFGDGVTGARVPTGRQNVVARYRQGLGIDGDVAAGRITTLLDRPPGLRAVDNPVAADGGVDPESMARAREIAPGTVRTFGRAVSLRDFEDTTLTAGIVAKASATWVWTGERRAIHVTVGGVGGRRLTDETLALVTQMLATERDPNHKLLLANYAPVPVLVAATLTIDDRHVTETVLAAAQAAVRSLVSFDAHAFAEPVNLSDVFSVLQGIEGVVFVDVDTLDLKSRDPAFRAAHGVDDSRGQPQPHLLMLPARPDRASGTVLPAELAVIEAPGDVTLIANGGLAE
jgi:hypothetical protein